MKRTFKSIGIIGAITISLCGSYLLGTTQAEIVTEIREVEKVVEVVPAGYIDTTTDEFYDSYVDMRKVTDFNVTVDGLHLYFNDGTGYYWKR